MMHIHNHMEWIYSILVRCQVLYVFHLSTGPGSLAPMMFYQRICLFQSDFCAMNWTAFKKLEGTDTIRKIIRRNIHYPISLYSLHAHITLSRIPVTCSTINIVNTIHAAPIKQTQNTSFTDRQTNSSHTTVEFTTKTIDFAFTFYGNSRKFNFTNSVFDKISALNAYTDRALSWFPHCPTADWLHLRRKLPKASISFKQPSSDLIGPY